MSLFHGGSQAEPTAGMKTYVCLNCGQGLESAEFAPLSGRFSLYRRCPSCRSPVSLSGVAFLVAGVLWALACLMIPTDGTEIAGIVGGGALMTLGAARIIRQHRAARRWKCEPGVAANAVPPRP